MNGVALRPAHMALLNIDMQQFFVEGAWEGHRVLRRNQSVSCVQDVVGGVVYCIVSALLAMARGHRYCSPYDGGMNQYDLAQTHERFIECEYLAAALQTEQQWLAQLQRVVKDYLDRPNAVTRGRLTRLLEALQRRATQKYSL